MEKIIIKIKRQDSINNNPYIQSFEYTGEVNIPVLTLLERLNNQKEIKNTKGEIVKPIKWDCSCLQGLCGSCAMVINEKPQLACKAFLKDNLNENNEITIEPLTKFPTIQDLKVDKSQIFEMMKKSEQWLESEAKINLKNIDFEYKMSECIMCGCCLEACIDYSLNNSFMGAPIAVSSSKLTNQEKDKDHKNKMKKIYKKDFYKNCTKSLICETVCPMEIPTQIAISKMNRKSVWSFWTLFGLKD